MVEERSGTVNKNEKNLQNYEEKAVFIGGAGWGSREGVAVGWDGGRLGFGGEGICSGFNSCYLLSLISQLVITYFSAVLTVI